MGAKFTCDWCGKESSSSYNPHEGWYGICTMEWWEDGKSQIDGYHINTFCSREWDEEKSDYSADNCFDRFLRKNNIVWQASEMYYGNGNYVQKKS